MQHCTGLGGLGVWTWIPRAPNTDSGSVAQQYNVGTWSTCEFEVLFFRSEGEEERRRRERERERESMCVNNGSA